MVIDARGQKHPEPLLRLREALREQRSVDEAVFVLVDTIEEARKVEVEDRGDHWRLRIDRACNCG